MRRIAITIAATVSVVVLLFSYRTSTDQTPVATGRPLTDTQPSSTAGPGTASANGTFTGDAADTRYGPVQVRITVSGGKITEANAIEYPQESGRDVRINSAAVPELNHETLQAQSAQIDTVSGATYTSEGYQQSLQSAILSVLVVVLVPLTTEAGEWLERRVASTPLVRTHTELGDTALWVAIPVALLALLVWWRRREGSRIQADGTGRRTFLAPASTAVTIVLSVLAIAAAGAAGYDIYRIGDSGAQASWQGQFSTSPAPRGAGH